MPFRHRTHAALTLLLAGATTAPTTAPTTGPAPPIARWFDQLADPDPAARDAARERIMGLTPGDLPALLDAVRSARPVRPAQAAALHEVVCHVVLSADPYDTRDDAGPTYIMGQAWPLDVRYGPDRPGVPVVERWPGFPARRFLRDGDLILGLYADADAPFDRPPDVPTHTVRDLVYAQQSCPSLPRMAMSVLRDGRVIRVVATLVPEPARTVGRRPGVVAAFLSDRQRLADDYWQAHVAPLLDGPGADAPDGTGP